MLDLIPKIPIPETAPQIDKIPEVPLTHLETLWLQVGGTLCNLACTHCFISCSPHNDSHPMMTLQQVRSYLEESKNLGVKDFYITGGEVFLNPELFEIYEALLANGPCHTLTNGMLITAEKVERLVRIQEKAPHDLFFRVSMESLDEKENNEIRGDHAFRLALNGIRNLAQAGFPTHLTMVRSWDEEEDPQKKTEALEFLAEQNVPHPQVKFLPGFLLGALEKTGRPYHSHERVTEKCFENWPITNLQCSSSRMATAKGVYVCPILIDDDSAKMGQTLKETLRPYPLKHAACYTCRTSGMTCKSA